MAEGILYPRFAERRLTEALEDSPVVLIQGPRQCGKTTLAQMVRTSEIPDKGNDPSTPSGRPGDYAYFSLDDEVVRAVAETDPLGFVAELPDRVIIDEVQRDVPEIVRIRSLDVLPRLLTHAAVQTASLFNLSELAAPFQVSRPTIRDYVTLLERVFLLERLPPWHSNRLKRLIKTPKLHLGDTGLACVLLGVDASALAADRTLLGQLLETFVYQELRRQASWQSDHLTFFHFRDKDGAEVDIVIERGTQALAGVEIKAGATVRAADFQALRKLKKAAGRRFSGGVVLYDGEACVRFDNDLYAAPLRSLWEIP